MHSGAAVVFILAALIAALILPSPAVAIPMEDDTVDRPNTDYPALFRAFLDLGNALFGSWSPDGALEEFIRKQEAQGLSY
ncbi:uncharacterized protein LOC6546974 [Drosophila erecta]|uniref:Uncharacterized protein n=1 Tax=Drosophila erecta TaxID=7220 RepID=B3NLP1_DROER|nr:uncharacterized protein LOC6546974 [Drosophila erecta]EDV55016.1 uncharacterized protein Dere_GG21842 [Drosophila erecta]